MFLSVLGILAIVIWISKQSDTISETEENTTMALSPVDPNSYARTDLIKSTHIHLDIDVDFAGKILDGHVVLSFEKLDAEASSVVLDVRGLTIKNATLEETGQVLEYELGSPSGFGEKLEIKLPSSVGKEFKVRIGYKTSPNSTALQWLSPAQTAG